MVLSKQVAFKALERSVTDLNIVVRVMPDPGVTPKKFIGAVVENVYFNKGASGSSPTETSYRLELCSENKCAAYSVSQDSRDLKMYWVSFIPFPGGNYPLGFTRLTYDKI